MGWKGKPSHPVGFFGSVVDTLIRQATCDVVLVKLLLLPTPYSPVQSLAGADGGWPQFQSGDSTSTGFGNSGMPLYPSLQVFEPSDAPLTSQF